MRVFPGTAILLALPAACFSVGAANSPIANAAVSSQRPTSSPFLARHAAPMAKGGDACGADGRRTGWLRDAVFPVYGRLEAAKFISLGGLQFFIIFVLTLTRDMKDALIVTHCGAEAISVLKVYGVLPAATLFMLYYSKLSSKLSKRALFYVTAAPFFVFYPLFAGVVYPNRALFAPSVALQLPERLAYVGHLYQHWIFALFYVVSELYSSVSIGVLFWQLANDIVPVVQAKRFYPLLGQLASLAPIAAGQCVLRFASSSPGSGGGGTLGASLNAVAALVAASGVAIFGLYEASNAVARYEWAATAGAAALTAETGAGTTAAAAGGAGAAAGGNGHKGKKPKLGLMESLKVLSRSTYLGYLAMLVLGYGMSISFTDVLWKSLLRRQYPDAVGYQRFMSAFSSALGATTFVVIFLGSNLIKYVGWRAGALATPLMMALLALPLFGTIIGSGAGAGGVGPTGAALHFVVMLGAVQSLLSKATKYALFDPTTQMAYIPLDEDSKVRGKAAIDGVGSRVGKAGASLIQQVLVFGCGSVLAAAPALSAILYGVLGMWMYAARRLSVLFEEKTAAAIAANKKGGSGNGHLKLKDQ